MACFLTLFLMWHLALSRQIYLAWLPYQNGLITLVLTAALAKTHNLFLFFLVLVAGTAGSYNMICSEDHCVKKISDRLVVMRKGEKNDRRNYMPVTG